MLRVCGTGAACAEGVVAGGVAGVCCTGPSPIVTAGAEGMYQLDGQLGIGTWRDGRAAAYCWPG